MAEKHEAAKRAMGTMKKEEKPAKRHVHKMEIERGAKGGFVAHHEMRGGEEKHESSRTGPHVIANTDDLHDHIDENMGDQPDAGAGEAPGGEDPAAQPAAGAPDASAGASPGGM
jgi:hypothetical protein